MSGIVTYTGTGADVLSYRNNHTFLVALAEPDSWPAGDSNPPKADPDTRSLELLAFRFSTFPEIVYPDSDGTIAVAGKVFSALDNQTPEGVADKQAFYVLHRVAFPHNDLDSLGVASFRQEAVLRDPVFTTASRLNRNLTHSPDLLKSYTLDLLVNIEPVFTSADAVSDISLVRPF